MARRIEVRSRKLVSAAIAGEYQSVFKGTGIEFDSVREYVHGDDVRSIDWNVTARVGSPHVKRFVESRERSVMLVLDRSPSLGFGSGARTKAQVGAELCAVLAVVGAKNRDRVGLAQVTDRLESFVRPSAEPLQDHRIVTTIVGLERPKGRRLDLAAVIDAVDRRLPRRAVVFLVSDFHDPLPVRSLRRLRSRHDVIAARITDPRERRLEPGGVVRCVDPETGEEFDLDTGSAAERANFAARSDAWRAVQIEAMKRAGVELVEFSTDGDIVAPLLRLFERRERRAR